MSISAEQLRARVREILLRDWDPCDVGNNPRLSDEYDDDVLPQVMEMLQKAQMVQAAEIVAMLTHLERSEFGISLPQERREAAARAILDALISLRRSTL